MAKIQTYTEKTALADDDLFIIADSAASNASKKVKASTVWKTDSITNTGSGANLTIVNDDGSAYIRIYGSAAGGNSSKIEFLSVTGVDFSPVPGDITFPSGSKFDSTDSFSFLANNGIKTNNITDNGGGDILINQTFSTGKIALQALDNRIDLISGLSITLSTSNNGGLDINVDGTGIVTMNGETTVTETLAAAIAAGDRIIVNGLICLP